MAALDMLADAYAKAHPIEIGRLLDRAQGQERGDFLARIPAEHAAGVLEVMMPLPAAETLAGVPAATAASIVARLDPRSSAALLGRLDPAASRAVLDALPDAERARLETLLAYDPQCAGSRIDPRVAAVPDSVAAEQVFDYLRQAPLGVLYYVYVLDEAQRLSGVFTLRELMRAAPEARVAAFMTRHPERVRAVDPFESVVRHPAWRRVHALPVVDASERFLGVLRYSVFRRVEAELGQATSGPDPARTASALAELYGLSAGGLAQWISGALGAGANQGGRR
jgi:magnesium transporter